jgi:DNA-binding protein HU-alpha
MTVKDRPERVGKNPKTGESIMIPASRRIAFKPGKKLIDAVAS